MFYCVLLCFIQHTVTKEINGAITKHLILTFGFILVVLFLGQLNAAVDAVHLQVANVRWLVALWLGEENEHVHRRELFEERVELLADVVMHLNAKLPAAVVTTVHLGTELLQDEHHLPHYFKVYRGHVVFTNVGLTKLKKTQAYVCNRLAKARIVNGPGVSQPAV